MALNDDLALLGSTPLFSDMPVDALRLLAFGAEHENLHAGGTLYHQDDAANCAYIIISGRVELLSQTEARTPVSMGMIDRAGLLGEIALIACHRLLSEYPEIATLLQKRIQQNLADLLQKLGGMGHKFQ
jgi:hypothetical protein